MDDKMIRFLRSIGIDNIDDFDLDFDMISKDRFNPKQYNMMVVKQTPWSYQRIRQLQDGLMTITYPYTLSFSYIDRPTGEDVISLFNDWYQTVYRMNPKVTFELDPKHDSHLTVIYPGETGEAMYKEVIKEFKEFLKFLNYEIVFSETVKEEEQLVEMDKEDLNRIVEAAQEEA